MTQKRQALGHMEVEAVRDCAIARIGDTLRGHEYHYSTALVDRDARFAYRVTKVMESTHTMASWRATLWRHISTRMFTRCRTSLTCCRQRQRFFPVVTMLNAAKLRLPSDVQQSLSIGRLIPRLNRQMAGDCLRYSRERFCDVLFRLSLCGHAGVTRAKAWSGVFAQN